MHPMFVHTIYTHSHSEESLPAPHYPRCSVLTPGCVQPSTPPDTPPRCEREQLSRSELPGLQRGGGGSGGRRGLPRRNAGLSPGQIRLSRGFPALHRRLPRVAQAKGWILRRKAREESGSRPRLGFCSRRVRDLLCS
jgi:hypothetical protein